MRCGSAALRRACDDGVLRIRLVVDRVAHVLHDALRPAEKELDLRPPAAARGVSRWEEAAGDTHIIAAPPTTASGARCAAPLCWGHRTHRVAFRGVRRGEEEVEGPEAPAVEQLQRLRKHGAVD